MLADEEWAIFDGHSAAIRDAEVTSIAIDA
jgi:hypothetical protein